MSRSRQSIDRAFFRNCHSHKQYFPRPAPISLRRDPRTEGSEHSMIEAVFCGHRLGLFQRNPAKGGIHNDMTFAVLQAKVRIQLGGRQ